MVHNNFKVALATQNGAYFLTPDEGRKNWELSGLLLKGENINKVVGDRQGNLYAASFNEGIFKSTDAGRTWKSSSKGLIVRKVWEIAADPHHDGTIYAGTQYGHLFKSTNYGETWEEVTSLHDAPNRTDWGIDWGYNTTGLALHTIKFDINEPKMIYLVAAGNGTYRSDDGGETWKSIKKGQNSTCSLPPEKLFPPGPSVTSPEERLKEHLSVHSDTHKIAISPKDGKVYQQSHCGIYFSDNHGDEWRDVSIGIGNRIGFPVDVVENSSTHVFVIPVEPDLLFECKDHNICIQGQLAVYSTTDGGVSWNKLTKGLPDNVHTNVLRDSLDHDSAKEPGLYFGTTTGEVFFSSDLGESWTNIASGLGRIQGVNVVKS